MADFARNPWIAAIVRLLFSSGPAAILWAVGAVVVDPFDGQTWVWPIAHILDEGAVVEPSIAHPDAATSITSEALDFWVAAAVQHSAPERVFWVFSPAMCAGASAAHFCAQTTAGTSSPRSEVVAENKGCLSTVADAAPRPMTDVFNRDEAVEPLVCNVNEVWHGRPIYS